MPNFELIHLGGELGVTGSCHLLLTEGIKILVDCGTAQWDDRLFRPRRPGQTAGMGGSDEAAAREDKSSARKEKGPTGPGRGTGRPALSGGLSFSDHRLTRIDANSGKGSWLAGDDAPIVAGGRANENPRRCRICHQISTYQGKNA